MVFVFKVSIPIFSFCFSDFPSPAGAWPGLVGPDIKATINSERFNQFR